MGGLGFSNMKFIKVFLGIVVLATCIMGQDNPAEEQVGSPTDLATTLSSNTEGINALSMKADDAVAPSPEVPTDTMAVIKEPAPPFSRAVWDSGNKICLLGVFQSTFTITYAGQNGDQTVLVRLPEEATTKGRCSFQHQDPVLEISWPGFRFTITFTKKPDESWQVTSMELLYNTQAAMFTGVTNGPSSGDIKTARTADNLTWFETPANKSFFCPSPPLIDMFNSKKEKVVTLKLQDMRLQPFGITKGKFSPVTRCGSIRIGGIPEPYDQDETVPMAVGSVLAVMAIFTVVGYALYKSIMTNRVDYDTMQ